MSLINLEWNDIKILELLTEILFVLKEIKIGLETPTVTSRVEMEEDEQ